MRILWFSNILITEMKPSSSGTWIISMLQELRKYSDIKICVISSANIKSPIRVDFENVEQWVIPYNKLKSNGLPTKKKIKIISEIVKNFNPDLIHIWGIENYWGLLTINNRMNCKVLIEIQGFKNECSKVYYGGLNFFDLFYNMSLVEITHPFLFPFYQKKVFKNWGKTENKIICNHSNINTQSNWVRSHINSINPNANIFKTGIILRDEITNATSWVENYRLNENQILTVSSELPYKGLHITIRAFAELKRNNPNLILKIAGLKLNKYSYLNSSYLNYLIKLSKKLNVFTSIKWLGNLNAEELVLEYYRTSVFILSSYVETYSLALAEALYVGVPSVVAYSSALPELAIDNVSALYYPVGEYIICANKIERILSDNNLKLALSKNSRTSSIERNNSKNIIENQIRTYKDIVNA